MWNDVLKHLAIAKHPRTRCFLLTSYCPSPRLLAAFVIAAKMCIFAFSRFMAPLLCLSSDISRASLSGDCISVCVCV